jgi:hypothetical protein
VLRRALPALTAALAALALVPAAASAPRVERLTLGDVFVVHGRTGSFTGRVSRATGQVVVRGRWGSGAWYVVTTTRTDGTGRYAFRVIPRQRGTLTLWIVPPDRHAQLFVLRVA